MEALDATGTFWFPGDDNLAVYGRLVFDPVDGTVLTPAKGITERAPDGTVRESWGGTWDRIFGLVHMGSQEVAVTLIDCIWLSRTRYRVNRLLAGGHFTTNDTTFHQAIIRLVDLPTWVADDALDVDVDDAIGGVERRELHVSLDRPPATSAPFNRGNICLDFRWSREDVEYERLTIGQWPQFELTYTDAATLDQIMEDAGSLQSLLTLCTDSRGSIDSVALYRPDYPERVLSGAAIPDTMRKIELLAPFSGARSPEQRKRIEPHRMLVSFADVGGVATVAAWLDESIRLRVIIGSLVTMRAEGIFGENRFLNVCSAAEGFHRSTVGGSLMDKATFKCLKRRAKKSLPKSHHEWLDSSMQHSNDPSLRDRLRQLVDQLGPGGAQIVGDAVAWAAVTSKCRNDLTHLEGAREQYNGGDLYWLAEGVFNVTRLVLFLHVGLDPAALPKLIASWPVNGAADRVQQAVAGLVGRSRK